MDKSLQTTQMLMELYELTRTFTRKLQAHYFYQYRGDLDDLSSEFFTQFITPKARGNNKKESLLDKFDPNTTSLAYLVKVCVTRKLIDFSKKYPHKYLSIDTLTNDNGDFITMAFNLINEQPESTLLNDDRYLAKVVEGYYHLDETTRNKHFVELFDSQSKLVNLLSPAICYIRECPIQQITERSAVVYIPSYRDFVVFSLSDGTPKGSRRPFQLNSNELSLLKTKAPYHSQFSRELMYEYLNSAYSQT